MRFLTNGARTSFVGMAAAVCCAGGAAAQDSKPNGKEPAPAVVVATVKNQEISQSTQFVGRVQAIQQTDLKARVEGFLEKVDFKEGAMVKAGEQLYQIETGPYEAALAGAQAALAAGKAAQAGAQAKLQDADLTLERQTTLLKSNTVSQAAVDKAQADRDQSYASVQSAEAQIADANAQIQTAELNLSYTKVMSPIDGRIGKTNYTKGNLVGPSSGTLSTVVQMDPMRVVFSISDRDYVQVVETVFKPDKASAPLGSAGSDTNQHSGDAKPANSEATDTAAAGSADGDSGETPATEAPVAVSPPPGAPQTDTADAAAPAAGSAPAGASDTGTAASGKAGSTAVTVASTTPDPASSDPASSDPASSDPAPSDPAPSDPVNAASGDAAVTPAPMDTPNVDVKKEFVPTLVLPNGQPYADKGKISFIDNEVDPNTGTIAVYADFSNKDFVLVPGQFVTVTVSVGQPKSMPVVPAGAVLQDRQGPYVLVVDKDNRAQIQRIETAEKMQTGWAVSAGLTQGQTIIVDGIQKVQPGMVVNPQPAKPAS